ncbi:MULTISPECIES: hypothetical protein [Pseudomonas]|uniref:hypothetical protein n=1 Tax=Pseudomonas TaxID=286 RepID=UPI000936B363|nr:MULTISPECIES: hypothetical protein [Pseudomonas]OJT30932.1 hypothetical protein BOP96_10130 [Pseudomonas sp. FSL W5-0203]QHA97081.1 hypothetical protein FXO12_10340 [Pseudomonas sp. J380]UOP09104.1 hypothetical protein LDL65_18615 [Pseudomonas palleroniana]
MAELDFDRAVKVARGNVEKLVPKAKNVTLEEAMTSADGRLYEVTFSYDIDREDNLFGVGTDNISKLASLMGRRREYKIFLVDADSYSFRGFRNYKEK